MFHCLFIRQAKNSKKKRKTIKFYFQRNERNFHGKNKFFYYYFFVFSSLHSNIVSYYFSVARRIRKCYNDLLDLIDMSILSTTKYLHINPQRCSDMFHLFGIFIFWGLFVLENGMGVDSRVFYYIHNRYCWNADNYVRDRKLWWRICLHTTSHCQKFFHLYCKVSDYLESC